MGIPPDPYPVGQSGYLYAGTTGFDPQSVGANLQTAEFRGMIGEDVVALQIVVIPPDGSPSIPIKGVVINPVNVDQPQIVVTIQAHDAGPIDDGYICQFSFQSVVRPGSHRRG